jgi:H+/Cl- antiporter ClcA
MKTLFTNSQTTTIALCLLLGILAGTASGAFLWSLDQVTSFYSNYNTLYYGLPWLGLALVYLYKQVPTSTQQGYKAVLQSANNAQVPLSPITGPVVWLATLASHLVGASVGREGTAVQIAGSIGAYLGKFSEHKTTLIQAGVAAGFGSVFGTPWAGVFFSYEVLRKSPKNLYDALSITLAAFVAHYSCLAWGITHGQYPNLKMGLLSDQLFGYMALALASGFTAYMYVTLHQQLIILGQKHLSNAYLRVTIGSTLLVAIYYFFPLEQYHGLSLNILNNAFVNQQEGIAFLLKLLLTTFALAIGFKGGEVTPLFVIGACMGSFLAPMVGLSVPMGAGLGMVAVFAGASGCPYACAVMGCELFGFDLMLVFLGINILANRLMAGKSIYLAAGK